MNTNIAKKRNWQTPEVIDLEIENTAKNKHSAGAENTVTNAPVAS